MNDQFEYLMLVRQQKILESKENFYSFCQAINPDFYKPNRWHLKHMCETFQSLYEGTLISPKTNKPYRNMSLAVPPGHGKSYTASLFSLWVYGQNPKNQIITVSYNEVQATKFARNVRDGITPESEIPIEIGYNDIFPNVKIKYGDASVSAWSLQGNYMSYLATSFNATITGNRGNIGIIDDPVKNHLEAFNETVLQNKWEWYTDTFISRMVEGAIQIVIATRWATKDLTGRLMEIEPDDWYELKLPACLNEETGEMLCPELMSFETYNKKKSLMSEEIFNANFQQEPMDVKGRLYQNINTYQSIPEDEKGNPLFDRIINYTDTADKGDDNLVSICAGVYQSELFILDILYTKDPMEVTEPQTAELLTRNKVNYSKIESNNGGRGFARNVERLLWDNHKNNITNIEWFHQSKNKKARILTGSSFVQTHVYFPEDWGTKWSDFYTDLLSFQKEGKNKHDDAQDCLTGLCEIINDGYSFEAVPSLAF